MAKTKKVVKRTPVKKLSLKIAGVQLRKLNAAYEAAGFKGPITKFAAKCLTAGIVSKT